MIQQLDLYFSLCLTIPPRNSHCLWDHRAGEVGRGDISVLNLWYGKYRATTLNHGPLIKKKRCPCQCIAKLKEFPIESHCTVPTHTTSSYILHLPHLSTCHYICSSLDPWSRPPHNIFCIIPFSCENAVLVYNKIITTLRFVIQVLSVMYSTHIYWYLLTYLCARYNSGCLGYIREHNR